MLKLLFSIIFIFTLLASPVLEKLSFVCENESTELVDIDTDNEAEEETIEFENKILDIFNISIKSPLRNLFTLEFKHLLGFTDNFSREIHTPPPELI